jgi:lactoylglutathione lyase
MHCGRSTTPIALVPAGDENPAGVETVIRLATAAMRRYLPSHKVFVPELLRWEGVSPMFSFRDPEGNVLEIVR